MENIKFSTFQDGIVNQVSAQDLFRNKRVLICSLTRPHDRIAGQYAEYLESRLDFYKANGIDEVYFVNSSQGKFLLAIYGTRLKYNQILLLSDSDQKSFASYLRTIRNKEDQDLAFLSTYWNYQAVFNNGELEFFSESSTTDPVKEAIKFDPGFFKLQGQRYLTEKPELIVWRPSLLFTKPGEDRLFKLVYYRNLWEDTRLEKFLVDNKSST
jgi:peroxiredoxin